jgi:AcrR family transcriptional regulator
VPPDSTATKARLFDAAVAEFAAHGLAGARVDRIAETAQANKRLIYVYYGSKEQLFDTVLTEVLAGLFEAVPFTAEDLPGFAGSLFDHLVGCPQLLRLAAWRQLERVEYSPVTKEWFREAGEAIAHAQQRGILTDELAPVDLLTVLMGMVGAWFRPPPLSSEVALYDVPPQRLQEIRVALTTAVRRAFVASPHPQSPGADAGTSKAE